MLQDGALELEARLMLLVGEHREDVVDEGDEELHVELVGNLLVAVEVAKHLEEDGEARVSDVALAVLDGPHDGVDQDLENVARDHEEGAEAAVVDLLQEVEEIDPVLREILHVRRNHGQSALKHGPEHAGDLLGDGVPRLLDDRRKEGEDLGVARVGVVVLIVRQHVVHQGGDKVLHDALHVIAPVHRGLDQPERLPLDRAHEPHPGGLGGEGVGDDGRGDGLGVHLVNLEHALVYGRQLQHVRGTQGGGDAHIDL
mmetsp:Transcript_33326/g.85439  ORF Transcript_33326/g.85439 Transcript_33326/m.85439 type:complete len:256 (-) Transcript_33326:2211-2978(-)